MNNITRLTKTAFALSLIGSVGLAHAQLSTGASSSFSGSASVTAQVNSAASATKSNNNAPISTVGIAQFDAATGVLVGTNIQLTSDRTQSIYGTGAKNNGPGRDANGSGSSTAQISATGASSAFSTAITQAGTGCSLAMGPTGSISCGWGPNTTATTATNASLTVSSSNLNDYVGNGSNNVSLSLPSFQATSTLSRTQGQASSSSTTYTVTWSGNVNTSYTYLLHAAPSFTSASAINSLTLDFGTVAQGSNTSPLAFSLFNMADSNRASLDLDLISGTGDTGKLTTNLASFTSLVQGGKNDFLAGLNTSDLGNFNARYLLTLSDADIGASATRSNYQLEVNLVGNVAAVPEPETYALMLAGLGLIGSIARRRKNILKLL